jgi:hypothetical protein
MQTHRVLVVCGLLVATPAVAEDRFTSGHLNFSIAMPTPEWSWSAVPDSNRVSARTADGDELVVWVSPEKRNHLTESWVRDVMRNAAKQAAADGARIESARIELATAPIQPSYRFSYVRVGKGGEKTYIYGYAAAAGRAYVLQVASPDRQSLALFNAFVSSFRVRDKVAAMRGNGAPPGPAASIVQNIDNPIGRPISPNVGHRPTTTNGAQ